MKVSDAITRMKSACHDIADQFTTDDYVNFLNTAIQQVASLLIAAKWPSLAKEATLKEGDALPHNYMGACGTYPVRMTDNKVHIIDDEKTVRFRYFATPDLVTADVDMPFSHEAINVVIVKSAVILALNENEYDVTQDGNILSSLQQAISSGLS